MSGPATSKVYSVHPSVPYAQAIIANLPAKTGHSLEKLKNTMDGDTHLLDQTAIIWGSPMGDPNLHNHRVCPLLLMGGANGALEGNLHLHAPEGITPAESWGRCERAGGVGRADAAYVCDGE